MQSDDPLVKIDRGAVRDWVAGLEASGLAPATVHKGAQILAKVMRAAVEDGLLVSSPCDRVELPRIERTEPKALDATGLHLLAETIDPRYRPLVLLGGYGGLWIGEMFALRREQGPCAPQ